MEDYAARVDEVLEQGAAGVIFAEGVPGKIPFQIRTAAETRPVCIIERGEYARLMNETGWAQASSNFEATADLTRTYLYTDVDDNFLIPFPFVTQVRPTRRSGKGGRGRASLVRDGVYAIQNKIWWNSVSGAPAVSLGKSSTVLAPKFCNSYRVCAVSGLFNTSVLNCNVNARTAINISEEKLTSSSIDFSSSNICINVPSSYHLPLLYYIRNHGYDTRIRGRSPANACLTDASRNYWI